MSVCIIAIDRTLYLLLVICNECITMTLYISICFILRLRIRDYNEFLRRLEERKMVQSSQQVQELYRLHSRLSSTVEGIEDNFSFSAFLWVVTIIFSVCVNIQAIVSGLKTSETSEFGYIFTGKTFYRSGSSESQV